MALLLALIFALLPLAIAQGLLFYYDVTPKTVVLLLGAATAVGWWIVEGGRVLDRVSRMGRWLTWTLLAMALSLSLSTVFSVDPARSLGGSTWRNWGLIAQLAAMAFTYLTAVYCAGRPDRIRFILFGVSASGTVTALYGLAQYFGWDPLLDARAYHVGEGVYEIVRPPSTLGHADYFGVWLICAVFATAAIALSSARNRWLPWACASVCAAAIFLSGTRAAWLGLVVGGVSLGAMRPPFRLRRASAGFAIAVAACGVFYFSPAGARMRARIHWAAEDQAGGSRFLLWRDSLRMAAARWPVGYGPETFTNNFAQAQSKDLARAYPDFYSESPHNVFIDALAAQGVSGALVLAALLIIGLAAAKSAIRGEQRAVAAAMGAGLAGMAVAAQFTSFTIATAIPFYMLIALLVSQTCNGARIARSRWVAIMAGVPLAICFAIAGGRALVADRALVAVNRALDGTDLAHAAESYGQFEAWRLPGASASLWYARRLAAIADSAAPAEVRAQAMSLASAAAEQATQTAEDRFNADYNLASLRIRQNDASGAEAALRNAIGAAPAWFKPHWKLALVLRAEGKLAAAEAEGARAQDLSGGKRPEVVRTLSEIRDELRTVTPSVPNK